LIPIENLNLKKRREILPFFYILVWLSGETNYARSLSNIWNTKLCITGVPSKKQNEEKQEWIA